MHAKIVMKYCLMIVKNCVIPERNYYSHLNSSLVVTVNNDNMCAIINTGAQVCVIEELFIMISEKESECRTKTICN